MSSKKSVGKNEKYLSGPGVLRIIFLILFMFAAGTILNGCGKEKKAEREKTVNVRISTAEKKQVQPYLETTGSLKAYEEVTVSSEVDGIVKGIMVEEGSRVQKGTLLAAINDIDYKLEEQRSGAALKQAEANLANAQAEFQRKKTLYSEELITRQQFDDISTRLALAEADLARAKSTLETSREKLSRTKIYSPLVGAVKEKRISAGDYVRNGTPLFQLIKVDLLKLNFTVSEKDAAIVKTGQEVVFYVDSYPGREFRGKVNLLYPNIEEKTRSLQAEALVPNEGDALKPGFFARTFIYTTKPREVILIPSIALLYDNSTVRVFIVDSAGKAREKIVKIGGKYGEYVEITEGIAEKEQIVTVGQNNLSEGVKVNVAR